MVTLVGSVISGRYPFDVIDSITSLVFPWVWNFRRSMLKSPIMYDSLFSLEILYVISDNLSANRSMSACGCVCGRYITPTIIDFFEFILISTNKDSIT